MSFIKNYGLFWERDRVTWGTRGKGNKGSLTGYTGGSREPVDFRDQAGVYVLYDGIDIPTMKVVYVGQAGQRNNDSLFVRLKAHTRDHLWNRWKRFSWLGVFTVGRNNQLVHKNIDKMAHLGLPGILDHLEGVLITLMEPPLNKRGGNWGGTAQYYQDVPEESDRTLEEVMALREEMAALRQLIEKNGND